MPKEYYFKEGCFIEEWHNSVDDHAMSVAKVRVEVGKTTKLHALRSTYERYVIINGTAYVTVDQESRQLREGDVVVIPPDTAQQIENTGEIDLIFLAICTPRFKEENYYEI